jgi:hypothetical protein
MAETFFFFGSSPRATLDIESEDRQRTAAQKRHHDARRPAVAVGDRVREAPVEAEAVDGRKVRLHSKAQLDNAHVTDPTFVYLRRRSLADSTFLVSMGNWGGV